MDYLTRTLKYATNTTDFMFHPICKELKLTSLIFADDVMLFSKVEVHSMMTLLRAYSTFFKASGLQLNPSKSSAYCRGIPDDIKQDIMKISGFS
ncbi:hypothetical protein vseg_011760 [Gypsophila vaccaria]